MYDGDDDDADAPRRTQGPPLPPREPDLSHLVTSAYDLARDAKDPCWVVEDLIIERGQVIVSGLPKVAKKSLLMFWLALCVAEGRAFLGCKTNRRHVFYVALEGGRARAAWRWRLFGLHRRDVTPLDRIALGAAFGSDAWKTIREALSGLHCLVIVDTLATALANEDQQLDENDARDMTHFLSRVNERLEVSKGATVVWVHHFRKGGDMMRGSGALHASSDGWWDVQPGTETDSLRVSAVMRDAPPRVLGARLVTAEDGTLSFEACDAPQVARGAANGTDVGEAVRRYFADNPSATMNQSRLAQELHAPRDAVAAVLRLMERVGDVERDPSERYGVRASLAFQRRVGSRNGHGGDVDIGF